MTEFHPDFRPEAVLRHERQHKLEVGLCLWALMLFIAIGFAVAPLVAAKRTHDAALVHTHGPEAAAYALAR